MSRRIAHRKPELLQSAALAPSRPVPIGSFSIGEFCESENISQSKYFEEARAGRGPATFKVGSRTLISTESASEWRKARTAAHAAAKAAEAADDDAIPKKENAQVAKPRSRPALDLERARAEIAEALAKIEKANAAIERASA
jgi:hypothetical protein